ncbi:hypothetical protein VI06_16180 [Aquitalea magnusonii]|nr:hypothetical protein VI06_16180 [Aquitalea magnusonii]
MKHFAGLWKYRSERWLLILNIILLFLLVAIEIQLPVPSVFSGSAFGNFLCAPNLKTILESLLSGLVSAYFFYCLVSFYPKETLKADTLLVLDTLIASVLDVYEKPGIFRHEAEIHTADINLVSKEWIKTNIEDVKKPSGYRRQDLLFFKTKSASQRVERRLGDFKDSLPLAVSVSPQCTLQWLQLIDKLTLIVETSSECPGFKVQDLVPWEGNLEPTPYSIYMSSICFRYAEFFEQVEKWIDLTRS